MQALRTFNNINAERKRGRTSNKHLFRITNFTDLKLVVRFSRFISGVSYIDQKDIYQRKQPLPITKAQHTSKAEMPIIMKDGPRL